MGYNLVMPESHDKALSLQLRGALAADIRKHARASRQSAEATVAKLLERALADQRAYDEWKLKAAKAGLADEKAGRIIPHSEVIRMLERARAVRARKKAA